MANFSIKIDLQKLKGAFLTNLKGKYETKQCICIPIKDANLFLGKQGTYLDLTAIEMAEQKYVDTHCIKQNLPKDVYERLSDDDKKQQPILGGMHELKKEMQSISGTTESEDADDLPF